MKAALERVDVPDSELARERARVVVLAAFDTREPRRPRRRGRLVALAAAVVVGGATLAALSPPGQAVVDRVREIVGVERAQPALFSLPAPGRLLVASDAGVWVVERDGAKRLLPGYREASWSPFGRFVVATKRNELAALEPDGDVRWTLARREVRSPRWTGTETDTRIAYVDRSGIRVVAGDGTGDHLVGPREDTPIAWRPGAGFVLVYLAGTQLRLKDTKTGRVSVTNDAGGLGPEELVWSPEGDRILVVRREGSALVDPGRKRVRTFLDRGVVDAAYSPDGRRIAVLGSGELRVLDATRPGRAPRLLFAGEGLFSDLAWSPDGRWLMFGWPDADQWIFVRADGGRIRAVSNVSQQFRGRPRIEGWCCAGGAS